MPETPLEVNADELRASANEIHSHACTFTSAHETAYALAGRVSLGSGVSTAALSEMLAAWDQHRTVFGAEFARHAERHRAAADGYETIDEHGGQDISQWG